MEHPGVLGPPVQHDDGALSLAVPSGDRRLPADAGSIDPDHHRRRISSWLLPSDGCPRAAEGSLDWLHLSRHVTSIIDFIDLPDSLCRPVRPNESERRPNESESQGPSSDPSARQELQLSSVHF